MEDMVTPMVACTGRPLGSHSTPRLRHNFLQLRAAHRPRDASRGVKRTICLTDFRIQPTHVHTVEKSSSAILLVSTGRKENGGSGRSTSTQTQMSLVITISVAGADVRAGHPFPIRSMEGLSTRFSGLCILPQETIRVSQVKTCLLT